MSRRGRLILATIALAAGAWGVVRGLEAIEGGSWVRVERRDLVIGVEIEGELQAVDSADLGPPALRSVWDFKISFMASEGSEVAAGQSVDVVGGMLAGLSPLNVLLAAIEPGEFLSESFSGGNDVAVRTSLAIGGLIASAGYIGIVFGMHASMKRSFMMSVRRLAGTGN